MTSEIPFVNIGARTNVTGSANFRKLITAGDFVGALAVARDQVGPQLWRHVDVDVNANSMSYEFAFAKQKDFLLQLIKIAALKRVC
jgi:cobalamin-dependent methionine synthase I